MAELNLESVMTPRQEGCLDHWINQSVRTVDIVIPCYNYARYLEACVSTVLCQTNVSVRVLIIDDCSNDDTPAVGSALAAANKNVEFRRHKTNKGHIATYNEGLLDWAEAEYSVLLSADDILAAGSLYRAIKLMEADSTIGMVYGRAVHFKDQSELQKETGKELKHTVFAGYDWLRMRCRAGNNVITSPEVVVRTAVQKAIGGYRPDLPHTGDLEMWLRFAAISNIGYVKGIAQAYYRVHPTSMLRSNYHKNIIDIRHRRAAFEAFFSEFESKLWEGARLREEANRALAREALWDACRAYDRDEVREQGAEELVDFAFESYDKTSTLPEFFALRRRRWFGAAFCNKTQVFAGTALAKRLGREYRKWRWQRQGV